MEGVCQTCRQLYPLDSRGCVGYHRWPGGSKRVCPGAKCRPLYQVLCDGHVFRIVRADPNKEDDWVRTKGGTRSRYWRSRIAADRELARLNHAAVKQG